MKHFLVLLLIATFTSLYASNDVKDTGPEMINGHQLPPEPDPTINNATLLGIDSNSNGVRDDVERWIYKRYNQYYPCEQGIRKVVINDKEMLLLTGREIKQYVNVTCSETPAPYHQIVREIAMQGARAAQIIIQDPENALETMKYMDAAVHCNGYFEVLAEYHNEPTLIDHFMFGDEFNEVQFNTVLRARAYANYNMTLSGGVYGGVTDEEARSSCDFNATKLLQDQ